MAVSGCQKPPAIRPREGKVQAFLRLRRIFRNYPTVALQTLFDRYPRRGVLRDGRVLELANREQFTHALDYEERGWAYDSATDTVSVPWPTHTDPLVFSGVGTDGNLVTIFGHQEYAWLQVADQTVVDIGCNIGDSVVYFASQGAARVIGLEPFPVPYSLAVRNVERNHFQSRVSLVRAACGDQDKEIGVDPDLRATAACSLAKGSGPAPTPMLSLATVAERFGVSDGVLKIDCEGGEYGIVDAAPDGVLRRFRQIQLEYHYGLGNLVERLRGLGFVTEFTEPLLREKPPGVPAEHVGYIWARRETAT